MLRGWIRTKTGVDHYPDDSLHFVRNHSSTAGPFVVFDSYYDTKTHLAVSEIESFRKPVPNCYTD